MSSGVASRSFMLASLQLLRLPTVFTALSNILCGWFISQRGSIVELIGNSNLWLLLGSSASLYLSGMVLNDVFDAKLDAIERPERPIPSGRISRRAATIAGLSLMALGGALAVVVGKQSALIAGSIAVAVITYDGWLKSTIGAPLGMGVCRFLNVMLGASAAMEVWTMPAIGIAAGLGIYIVGVTVFARDEAGASRVRNLIAGLSLLCAGLVVDGWTVGQFSVVEVSVRGCQMALLLLGLNLLMRGGAAIGNPLPQRIQKTVGLMLLSVIILDGIVVFGLTGDARMAAAVVILIPPAMLARRFIAMT